VGSLEGLLGLRQLERGRFGPGADTVSLPEAKPGILGECLVVFSIGGREIARVERSLIGNLEKAFQPLDLANGTFRVHPDHDAVGGGKGQIPRDSSVQRTSV